MREISTIGHSSLIPLHDESWAPRQRKAGEVLAKIMTNLIGLVKDKSTMSLLEMDRMVQSEIEKNGCTATFKGYKGFPNALITSVNKQLVHGIPSSYRLEEGDLISFDFGVSFEGAVVDSATTQIFGVGSLNHQKMIAAGEECLYSAIRQIRPGKRIGSIGNAIYRTAKNKGFRVIEQFGGHGIAESEPHSSPFVPNRAAIEEGVRIIPGMSLAIEPLLVPGNCSISTRKGSDGWTIYTDEVSCHIEHSVFIHKDRIEIMSHRSNESIEREILF